MTKFHVSEDVWGQQICLMPKMKPILKYNLIRIRRWNQKLHILKAEKIFFSIVLIFNHMEVQEYIPSVRFFEAKLMRFALGKLQEYLRE